MGYLVLISERLMLLHFLKNDENINLKQVRGGSEGLKQNPRYLVNGSSKLSQLNDFLVQLEQPFESFQLLRHFSKHRIEYL
jgi:hypothetical protein